MKQALTVKNGYIEYMWKNPGETEERAKAGYLSWYEPWDLIIWVSAYRSEFAGLVDSSDIGAKLNGIT